MQRIITASDAFKDILLHVLCHLPPSSVLSLALVRRSSYQFICGPETLEFWQRRFLAKWDDSAWLSKVGIYNYRREYLRRRRAISEVTSKHVELDSESAWKSWEIVYEVVADHKGKNIRKLIKKDVFRALKRSRKRFRLKDAKRKNEAGALDDSRPQEKAAIDELAVYFTPCLRKCHITIMKTLVIIMMRLIKELSVSNSLKERQVAQESLRKAIHIAGLFVRCDPLDNLKCDTYSHLRKEQKRLMHGLDWIMRMTRLEAGQKLLTGHSFETNLPFFAPAYIPVGQRLGEMSVLSLIKLFTGRWFGSYLYPRRMGEIRHQVDGLMRMELWCSGYPQSTDFELGINGRGNDDYGDFTLIGIMKGRPNESPENRSCNAKYPSVRTFVTKIYPGHSYRYSGVLVAGGIVGRWGWNIENSDHMGRGSFAWWPASR